MIFVIPVPISPIEFILPIVIVLTEFGLPFTEIPFTVRAALGDSALDPLFSIIIVPFYVLKTSKRYNLPCINAKNSPESSGPSETSN